MLTIPNIIVNCDCGRTVTLTTWATKDVVIDTLRNDGWTVGKPKPDGSHPVQCQVCAAKEK